LAEDAKHNGEGYPTLPILDDVFKVNRRDAAWVDGMCIKHPLACFQQKVSSTGAITRVPERTYVLGTGWGPPQPFMAIAERRKISRARRCSACPAGTI
jgi:hypothetical protein